MRVCERVFNVGLGPGLDSMSPARSMRSTSHASGTHGWLPRLLLSFSIIEHNKVIQRAGMCELGAL